jgi:hypothetical protein
MLRAKPYSRLRKRFLCHEVAASRAGSSESFIPGRSLRSLRRSSCNEQTSAGGQRVSLTE